MSNFRDMVNANIPKPKLQSEIDNENIEIVKSDVNNIAKLIRTRILDAAQGSTSNNFSYKGVLLRPEVTFFNTREACGSITGQVGTWLKYIDLGVYSTVFLLELKKNLEKDDIEISEWKIATHTWHDMDYFDSIRSMSGKWSYYYKTEDANFFKQKPISFNGAVTITYDYKYHTPIWRYNGKKYWARYSWGEFNESTPCICTQISYHN